MENEAEDKIAAVALNHYRQSRYKEYERDSNRGLMLMLALLLLVGIVVLYIAKTS